MSQDSTSTAAVAGPVLSDGLGRNAQYAEWREFYERRINGWMTLHDLRDAVGRMQSAGEDPSPELLLIHAMHMLEQRASWLDGEPQNLQAAAADADEWLALIERLHAAGRWQFSESDSRYKLACCRDALQRFLRPNVEAKGLAPKRNQR